MVRDNEGGKRIWNAPAERSVDGAFDMGHVELCYGSITKAVSRFRLPPHSKLVELQLE